MAAIPKIFKSLDRIIIKKVIKFFGKKRVTERKKKTEMNKFKWIENEQ